jgi:hypothetical protein
MASFLALCFVIFLLTLPFRLALRHRPPAAVVVVVQIPALPQAPMTLEQELARLQACDGAR